MLTSADSVRFVRGLPCGVTVMEKIKIEQHSVGGLLWFSGWLFTIGFLKLAFWKGVLALLLWPYYVGVWVSRMLAAGS